MEFKDLEFKPNGISGEGKRAVLNFDNGYGVSVITGPHYYTHELCPYELAILKNGSIDYDHPEAHGDVRGYLTEQEVSDIMDKVINTKGDE